MKKTKCTECEKKDVEITMLKRRAASQMSFEMGKETALKDVIKILHNKIVEMTECDDVET